MEEALDTLLVLLTRAPANARKVVEAERHCRALFVDYLRTCGVVGRQVRAAARARLLTTLQCGMLLCSGPAHAQRGGAHDGLSMRATPVICCPHDARCRAHEWACRYWQHWPRVAGGRAGGAGAHRAARGPASALPRGRAGGGAQRVQPHSGGCFPTPVTISRGESWCLPAIPMMP